MSPLMRPRPPDRTRPAASTLLIGGGSLLCGVATATGPTVSATESAFRIHASDNDTGQLTIPRSGPGIALVTHNDAPERRYRITARRAGMPRPAACTSRLSALGLRDSSGRDRNVPSERCPSRVG